jgi:phenylalanine ammonia-lyase
LYNTGVTTGFGGSANTTTSAIRDLQLALLQLQHTGVLPVPINDENHAIQNSLQEIHEVAQLSMPESWVRGAILIRCNSLLRGHSSVRLELIKAMVKLLHHDIVPLVPLRGSISASGDLCPLSYVAGTLEGNPDIRVWSGPQTSRRLIPADQALKLVGLKPVSFQPKEALGLLNGTAFSVAVSTIAQHRADILAVLAQILTAIGVEALLGTTESFHPFIGAVRPHRGQVEVAQNICVFLKGSKLAQTGGSRRSLNRQLRQDRYALRTSSQWLGPILEDLGLARQQIEIELNSTTDNPLIDVANNQIHHGGNFQASSTTSSTEKTRLALEKIGRLLFAQSTELLDARLNYNLPPNLAADEPSLSYTMKGVDINMAAYMSELSYVANPVSTHVLSAEMSNQAVNSLALISARATQTAVDIVSLMSSAYLYSLCQALDLRAMNERFLAMLETEIQIHTSAMLGRLISDKLLMSLHASIWSAILNSLAETTSKDSSVRFIIVAQSAQYLLVEALGNHTVLGTKEKHEKTEYISLVTSWTQETSIIVKKIFLANRESYLAKPDASEYLGSAAKRLYKFIRNELKVPMNRGLIDHPTFQGSNGPSSSNKRARLNTGSYISQIYQALKDERLMVPIIECLKEAVEMNHKDRARGARL